MVVHTFDLSTWEAETSGSLELEVSLVYIVSSETARATREKPCLREITKGSKRLSKVI